jgi:hypothetical protein
VLLCEFSLAAQVFENSLKLVCQVLKHLAVSLRSNSCLLINRIFILAF